MAYEVVMPKMGESIVEGTIIDWKKKAGLTHVPGIDPEDMGLDQE